MRVLFLIDDASVFELDVEVLINRMQRPFDGQIVLQLHDYFPPHQILEVREEQLHHHSPIFITQTKIRKQKTENKKQETNLYHVCAEGERKGSRWWENKTLLREFI